MQRAEEATYAEFERLKRELIEPSLSRHGAVDIKGKGKLATWFVISQKSGCANAPISALLT
jgi:adenylate cyclase